MELSHETHVSEPAVLDNSHYAESDDSECRERRSRPESDSGSSRISSLALLLISSLALLLTG
jgi:hypothetical protein